MDTPGDGRRDNVAKEDRGFASMDRAKQREIASKGGKAAHQKGTAHEWTSEEARDAGRKGGIASHQRRREQMGDPNTEVDDTQALGSNESMRNSSSSESSSSSSSSMDSSRDDYSQRDGWSRDE
jgi:general stress protein YciG